MPTPTQADDERSDIPARAPSAHPQRVAEAFAAAERLRRSSLDQAATAAELCATLAFERLKALTTEIDAYDVNRLMASMRAMAAAGREPLEAIERAASKGALDFPFALGGPRAGAPLRAACKAVLAEFELGRASLPARLEAIDLSRSVPEALPPARVRPSGL